MLLFATSVMPGLQYAYAAPAAPATPSGVVVVYDDASFDAAIAIGPLKTYYEQYDDEDLYCTDHKATSDDLTYKLNFREGDSTAYTDKYFDWSYWGQKVQQITNVGDTTEKYYIFITAGNMDGNRGTDEYELFSAVTCDMPDEHPVGSKIYPAWTTLSDNTDGCYYAAPGNLVEGSCN